MDDPEHDRMSFRIMLVVIILFLLLLKGSVAQLAEAVDLKSIQCGFESHRSYLKRRFS